MFEDPTFVNELLGTLDLDGLDDDEDDEQENLLKEDEKKDGDKDKKWLCVYKALWFTNIMGFKIKLNFNKFYLNKILVF